MRGLAAPRDTTVYTYIFNVTSRLVTRTPFSFHYGERLTKQGIPFVADSGHGDNHHATRQLSDNIDVSRS